MPNCPPSFRLTRLIVGALRRSRFSTTSSLTLSDRGDRLEWGGVTLALLFPLTRSYMLAFAFVLPYHSTFRLFLFPFLT